jgi:hypothetical protein
MGAVAILVSLVYWLGLRFFPVISIWVSLVTIMVMFCLIAFIFFYNGGALTVSD